MSLTLRQVRYFVATAEIGQISQAAIHLNISQSAVTTAIKELEGMLGTLLFQRSAQGMSLTDAGRHFLNRAYVILRSVDDALNSPLPDIRASGLLRLAASYTVIGYFLPHHLQRLEHWHPDVAIEVHEQERQAIEQGLLEGRFDMAVVLTANLTHPDIVSEILFNSERRLWLPSHHPLCERSAVSLADVAQGALHPADRRRSRTKRHALLGTRAPAAQRAGAHQFSRSGAQHGRQWQRRGDPLGPGAPSLVAGRQTHRNPDRHRQGDAHERRPGLASRARFQPGDAGVS